MTKETTMNFPDINEAFIGTNDLNVVCSNYINILKRTENFYYNQYGNKLLEFNDSDSNLSGLEIEYYELKDFLSEWAKKYSVRATIFLRKKNFIAYNSKIRLFLTNGLDLSTLRDLLGFKIALWTPKEDNLETQKLCYQLMNDLLNFLSTKRKALLLNAESRWGNPLDPESEVAQKIFVYDKSFLNPEFESKVKNYVLFPKDTGYQGLHAYINTPAGIVFEIQVKTLAMEVFDESIHEKHKKQRYANFKIALNYSKINISGVIFDENDYLICDLAGLLTSTNPLNNV